MGEHLRRSCIMCRRVAPQETLMRFVMTAEGLRFDVKQICPGRGAYVHREMGCWTRMGEIGRWEHAFRFGKGELQRRAIESGFENVRSMIENAIEESRKEVLSAN